MNPHDSSDRQEHGPALGRAAVTRPPRPPGRSRSVEEVVAGLALPPSVHVVVNDPARATRSDLALAALSRITAIDGIVVATGSHVWDESARARHEAWLRAALPDGVAIHWHDARSTDLVACGGGARVDRRIAEADAVVGVGSVEPHWFAGLTGVHKTLTIGVLDRSSIERDHAAVVTSPCRPLDLAGNVVHRAHRELFSALHGERRVDALQHVAGHWDGGEVFESLERLLPWARAEFVRRVTGPLDWVWSRVEGPLSDSLYQADKGIKNVEHAVRDGGAIVLEAGLPEGVGPDRFVRLLGDCPLAGDTRPHVARHGYSLGDHKAVRWRDLQARGVRIGLLGADLPADLLVVLGATPLPDANSAWSWLRATVGGDSTGVVVEDAGNTVLEVR